MCGVYPSHNTFMLKKQFESFRSKCIFIPFTDLVENVNQAFLKSLSVPRNLYFPLLSPQVLSSSFLPSLLPKSSTPSATVRAVSPLPLPCIYNKSLNLLGSVISSFYFLFFVVQ